MTYANRRVFVVVPAAGCGSRMQSDRPKQYLPLGRSGQTVLQTTVLALLDVPEIDGIYVAVSPEPRRSIKHSRRFRTPSPTTTWFLCMMPRAPLCSRRTSPT